ncbi:MAG: 5-formyltetrahydrofolate cyclo-ligase [Bacteroidales bacterium]|nr:5-formyltetrahydrofolate cyclo-ligase [Bacteroidales bacterium]
MEKAEVRKRIRELKRAVPPEEKLRRSRVVMQRLEHTPDFAASRVVLLYWSMADEVQTHEFVERWYREKTLLLPCVQGDDLVLRQYTGPECMVSGEQFGIGEPTGAVWADLEAVQLIAVPGVAFDPEGNRMGRGRGFYDRLLKSTPNAVKIGLAYDFQVLDHIPTEPHDVRMDHVLTDAPMQITEDRDK